MPSYLGYCPVLKVGAQQNLPYTVEHVWVAICLPLGGAAWTLAMAIFVFNPSERAPKDVTNSMAPSIDDVG
jgi:hypothetical protein